MSFFNKALLLLLVVGLVAKASCTIFPIFPPTNPADICRYLPIDIRPCNGTLQVGPVAGRVPLDCCISLKVIQTLNPLVGIRTTCECARLSITAGVVTPGAATPAAPPTAVSFSAQIQAACGVNVGYSLDPRVSCP
ncbi:hypothetical protein OWV82_023035 [Melia azedarach]|uniref:Uncharacterized protein n=1 Tax=Melia azedarach TaxID=155640 RepID=A0ACC1WVS5_MELAZ|nr:hypothetical protein OWV82_023035 [Melia azedarach]